MVLLRSCLVVLLLASCGDGGSSRDGSIDATTDAPEDAPMSDAGASPPALTACNGTVPDGYGCAQTTLEGAPCGTGGRACFFRVMWNETTCPAGADCRLAVQFSGGAATCDVSLDEAGEHRTGWFWTDNGFVWVCAEPFISARETEAQLYSEETPIIVHLLQTILRTPEAIGRSDETQLSVQGVSHGGWNVLLMYLSGETVGTPRHIVVYDGGGDIGLIESHLAAAGLDSLHDRFVRRSNATLLSPATHPSTEFPFCAGEDSDTDARYRRDSTDWSCTDEPGHLGSAYSCGSLAVGSAWRLYGCDEGGATGETDVPDIAVECTSRSLESCGVEATYVEFGDTGCAPSVPCNHIACSTDFCAARDACAWITGAPCTARRCP